MGCNYSSPAEGVPPPVLQATGAGGSLIMSVNSPEMSRSKAFAQPDALEATKGGSYIIGRKVDGEWEPGVPIQRPENTATTAYTYINTTGGSVLRISYGCTSEQGRSARPPHKENQDSFLALGALGNNPALAVFGVFDGHGPHGEDAAHFCRIHLPDAATRHPRFAFSPEEALAQSF